MKFAVNTWQSDFKVNLHIRRVFLLTATKRYGRISIRRLIMLGPLFTRPYGQKIVKHCVQNFESCHIKSKILYPEHFKEKSTLENNIHRAKACSKFGKVYFCQKIHFAFLIEWCLGIIVLLVLSPLSLKRPLLFKSLRY